MATPTSNKRRRPAGTKQDAVQQSRACLVGAIGPCAAAATAPNTQSSTVRQRGGRLGSVRYMTYTSCRACNFDTTGGGTPGNTVRRRGGKVPYLPCLELRLQQQCEVFGTFHHEVVMKMNVGKSLESYIIRSHWGCLWRECKLTTNSLRQAP